jgi:hypothetical protein
MSGSNQNLLKESNILRDYTHANLTFGSSFYEKAPKLKFLFHVYFDINDQATTEVNSNYGLLVKTVKLPSYNMQVDTMNQYNRKRLIQTKIKYDAVDITFHDDTGTATGSPAAGGMIRSLWKAYYNYYYADGRNPTVVLGRLQGSKPNSNTNETLGAATAATYNDRNQYADSITGNANWGYIGDLAAGTSELGTAGKKVPFFKNITVFGFSQHRFTAYTLINPLITSFSHDTYDYAQGNGVMENKMTLEYETVVYNEGDIDGRDPGNIVTGFGMRDNYDLRLSPIATPGSNAVVPSQAGLVEGGSVNTNDGTQGEEAAQIAYNYSKNVGAGTSQVAIKETQSVDQPINTRTVIAQFPSFQAAGNGLQFPPSASPNPAAVTDISPAGSQNGPVYGKGRNASNFIN